MRSAALLFLLVAGLFISSCASDSSADKEKPAATLKSLSQRLEEKNGYTKDADGNWSAQNDKRSQFETQNKSQFADKQFKKSEYKTGDYKKTTWAGDKTYATQAYTDNTDASRFKSTSKLQGQNARETNINAKIPSPYQTNQFATNSARESSNKPLAKPSNDNIANRRAKFNQPKIIDWQEQRAMSLEQSKGILGR